ncbi:MAG TPA: diadenylate cyclase CdaA [Dehalococcoidia bacterium]|nr:diadenylate cyclase CdaA [Dehalococcoidia bacterium]
MADFIENIRDALERLDAAAALDIFIIAAVIYALLMALRGTTAMTLLRGGVAVVCLLVLFGQVLDLSVVNFILRNSLPGLVVGLFVIFQPEIRRALEKAGRTSVRAWLFSNERSEQTEAIATAVAELSRRRHGAIIVIERGTGLEEVVETGIKLDAAISHQLLEGIFFPNSPLHDKAVVVRGDRVLAACCTLPLAESAGAARLGTRHRAALGITERTDAISIVVSEETGAVSVASDGRLLRLRDETRIRPTLEALITGSQPLRPALVS